MTREELSTSVVKHRDTVYRVALGYVKNVHDADDITQNVFMKLYNHTRGFETEESRKAWLIRVAINECKDLLKSIWRANRADLTEISDESLVAPVYDEFGLCEYVRALKPKYRTVIYLHYFEGYSTKEIGRILKMPQSTVTTHLNRARKQLKQDILDENEKERNNYELQGFI